MPRTLFASPRSPYARKVRIVLAEKGLPFELVMVDLASPPPGFASISPLGKVPAFVDADGTTIFDSSVIVEYLEDRHGEVASFGRGWRERLRHRELDELGDTIGDQAVLANQAKGRGDSDGEKRHLDRAARALDEVGRRLDSGDWPEEFGVGPASVLSGIGYLVLRHGDALVRARPRVERWLAEIASRASVAATAPPPA